jgi:hypothetical protein
LSHLYVFLLRSLQYYDEAINRFEVEESRYVAGHPVIVLKPTVFSSGLFPPRHFRLFAWLSMPSEHTGSI